MPKGKLYRTAEAEILEDLDDDRPDEPRRAELIALFRRAFERRQKLDPDLASILENALPLGVLTDIVAHALGLPAEVKQQLLAEPRVDRRAGRLLSILRQMLDPEDPDGDRRRPHVPAPLQRELTPGPAA